MSDSTKQNIFHIIEYLTLLKASGANADNIDTITSLLEAEFGVSYDVEGFRQYSTYPEDLAKIIDAGKIALKAKSYGELEEEAKSNSKFDGIVEMVTNKGYFKDNGADLDKNSLEYLRRYAKLAHKVANSAAAAGPSQAELEKQAEELKQKGNAAVAAKDFKAAVDFYSEAIKLSPEGPSSHVYFCNRAAAYCYLNRYNDAVNDSLSSVALSPDYVKAFSRLGLAYYHLEKYQEALEAYERAAELEPDNAATMDSLRQVKNKLKKAAAKPAKSTGGGAGADLAGLPGGGAGLAGLMNNPAMKKAFDQVGGSSGLANLMKDPQMMAMAQQMMKDPTMMQQAMSMLGGGGGDAGGLPDMSALAGLMGGGGGGAPSSGSVPSSSSKGGKKPFKGFEE